MARHIRFAAASALAAAIFLPVMPAEAAPSRATRGPVAYDASASTVHQAYGWRYPSRDGVYYPRGVFIPGSRDDREDDEPRWAVPDDRQYYSNRQGYDNQAQQRDLGLDRIADMCVDVVERERSRVNVVDGISREREGWLISGALYDGDAFSCRISNDGQLQDVHFGRRGAVVPMSSGREDFSQPVVQRAPSAVQRGDDLSAPALRAGSSDQPNRYVAIPPMQPRADDGASRYSAAPASAPAPRAQDGDNYAPTHEAPALSQAPVVRGPAAEPAAAPQPQAQQNDNYAAARELPALSGTPPVRGPIAEPAAPAPSADVANGNNYAAVRELPAKPVSVQESESSPALLTKSADPAPAAAEAPAPAATGADEASAPADGGVLPPADTSEALPVDPDKSRTVAKPAQPQDDGRYDTSKSPDFGQSV